MNQWIMTAAVLFLSSQSLTGAEWGTIKGKFVLKGETPEVKPVAANRINDPFCQQANANNPVVEEDFVVGKEGEFANVCLYLKPPRGKKVDVHAEYEKTAKDTVMLDNKECRFQPHVIGMVVTQTLEIHNSDGTAHNSQVSPVKNPGINPQIPSMQSIKHSFKSEEALPIPVACNAHTFMKGWILIRENPYFAISGEDGAFEIKNVPVGEHIFVVKHADTKFASEIEVDGKPVKLSKGEWKIKVEAGEKDLGVIAVSLAK